MTSWAAIADTAIGLFEEQDVGDQTPHALAYAMAATARRTSWTDPRIQPYLDRIYDLRNSDLGWGLNEPFDAFGDGSENPLETSYSITLADHVGPPLLEAHLDGHLVPWDDVRALGDWLWGCQAFTFPDMSRCIVYSRLNADKITATNGRNVHNVNAQSAAFLLRLQSEGYSRIDLTKRCNAMLAHEMRAYNVETRWWPYQGSGAKADTDHTAAQADAMYRWLAQPVGQDVAYKILTDRTTDDKPTAAIAHVRLASLPLRPGSPDWPTLAAPFQDEVEAFLVASVTTARQRAQIAYWASAAPEVA